MTKITTYQHNILALILSFSLVFSFASIFNHAQASTEDASSSTIAADDDSGVVAKGSGGPRDNAGKVVKANGKVYYHPNGSVRSKRVRKNTLPELFVHDMLRTKKKAKAFLKLTDGSRIILEENSVIHFNGVKEINAEKGIVLFDIKKQGKLKGLKITTKTAVIGIKGTQFVIDTSNNDMKLYMKEGLVNVEAKDGGTFKHILKEEQSYKDYLKEMFTTFSDYKKKQEEEFVEFVKSIDVPANKAISISGNRLEDIEIPSHIKEQFEELDSFDENAFKADSEKLDKSFSDEESIEDISVEKKPEVDSQELNADDSSAAGDTTQSTEPGTDNQQNTPDTQMEPEQQKEPVDKIKLDESMSVPGEKEDPKDPFSDMKI